ncbi:putative cation-transporting ATPase 1 [Mycoemilia scoparia]|uniref:Cation-transporting ATPase 1 n=1 Tax=Mycoemilia scoparia TaxID=417184 RepID=A0A9W8A0J1_9FUNG|nr:putative cation-transporting ATPase 1 [Mycoemilia scoparia]
MIRNVFSRSLRGPSSLASITKRFYSLQATFSTDGEKHIHDKLAKELSPASLQVSDISGGCGSMYVVEIQAEAFRGKNSVQQHRMVNAVLKEELKEMHGLRIVSSPPKDSSASPKLVDAKSITSASLHRPLQTTQHAYVWPFLFTYPVWLYIYTFGYDKYFGSTEYAFISFMFIFCIQALLFLSGEWSVDVKAKLTCKSETDPYRSELIKVNAAPHCGKSAICPLIFDHENGIDGKPEISFNFQAQLFIYDENKKIFSPAQYPPDFNPTLEEFQKSKGLETDRQIAYALHAFGNNKFNVPVPTFVELFKEHAKAPFFVFQIFCVGLWCLDEYWYYSLFTLFMLIVFESTVVFQRLKTLGEFHSLSMKPFDINVYRKKEWSIIKSDELIPGDIISIDRSTEDNGVPCDALLLDGTCIVNEAMLSGESTPQLKESIKLRDPKDVLDMEGSDKNSTLFGGTKVLQVTPPDDDSKLKTPDGGCLGYVLRTGFGTSQGKLVRTMVFSTERVSADNAEAYVFIGFLLIFAILASAYVWIEGGKDGRRAKSKLLLDCVLIITSVVPPELPMELSMAVNSSLVALSRLAIFCTEPFRIPNAGKVDICCFDKTGTLTGENLVVEGISSAPDTPEGQRMTLLDPRDMSRDTTLTLAAAHALVKLDDEQLVGDPMERAQVEAVGFRLADSDTVVPADPGDKFLDSLPIKRGQTKISIIRRFAFSSALKRSSTLCQVTGVGQPNAGYFVAAKGAPEIMRGMLSKVPEWYDETYKHFSRRGGRVLTLGCKWLPTAHTMEKTEVENISRDSVESSLEFQGFLVFTSPLKPDSKRAILMLSYASHRCVMITGDNSLTAVHVAEEVGMLDQKAIVIDVPESNGNQDSSESDQRVVASSVDESVTFDVDTNDVGRMERVLDGWDLCLTGAALKALGHTALWKDYLLHHTWVYARVSPVQKEFILTEMKSAGYVTLMTGDGSNDVGALKQAHIGVALLDGKPEDLQKIAERQRIERLKSAYDAQLKIAKRFNQPPPNPPPALRQYLKDQAEKEAKEAKRRRKAEERAAAVSGMVVDRVRTDADRKARLARKRADEIEQQVAEARSNSTPQQQQVADLNARMSEWLAQMDSMEDEVPTLKFGDASVAAPFTSKLGTVMAVCNIVRQGRCTLVATVQMYKILALNCLISAYSLSVLYLDGIKFGDWQATIMGVLMSVCFFCISKASPLEKLSRERPQSKIVSVYVFATILGQFAVHVAALIYITLAVREHEDREDVDIDGVFEPSLLNTAMYLISLSQQVSTFAINYQGHPFREALRDNKYLYRGLLGVGAIAAICATESVPELNEQLKLVKMPSSFRDQLCIVMALDFGGSYVVEFISAWLFSSTTSKPICIRAKEVEYPEDPEERKAPEEVAVPPPNYNAKVDQNGDEKVKKSRSKTKSKSKKVNEPEAIKP